MLRGAAAIMVTAFHFCLTAQQYGSADDNPIYNFLLTSGLAGVDIFFCISGFVMMVTATRGGGTQLAPVNFLVRRAIRILPLYWLATSAFIVLVLAVNAMKSGIGGALALPELDPGYLMKSYLLWPARNPADHALMPFVEQGWTLSYEIVFYLLFALTAWRFRRPVVVVAVLFAAMLATIYANPSLSSTPEMLEFFSNKIVFEFAMGAAVFVVAQRWHRFGFICLAGGTALLCGLSYLIPNAEREFYWGIPAALLIYGLVATEGNWRYPRLLRVIGDASYSLYLTHGMVTYLYGGLLKRGVLGLSGHPNLAIAAGCVLAVLLGLGVYRWIERPLTDALNRRHRRLSGA